MFTTLDRPASPLYLPKPRYFFSASAWVAIALAVGGKFAVSLGALIPKYVLLVVMAALVAGWVQVMLTYRSIRNVQIGGTAEAALLHTYKTQLRRVVSTAIF